MPIMPIIFGLQLCTNIKDLPMKAGGVSVGTPPRTHPPTPPDPIYAHGEQHFFRIHSGADNHINAARVLWEVHSWVQIFLLFLSLMVSGITYMLVLYV